MPSECLARSSSKVVAGPGDADTFSSTMSYLLAQYE